MKSLPLKSYHHSVMKRIILPFLFLLFAAPNLFAQRANAVLFTEQGERFSLMLNGVLQNQNPTSNIRLNDLIANTYRIKVIFEDRNLGEFDRNLFVELGSESTYNLKRNNHGEWVMRLLSVTPLMQVAPVVVPNQTIVTYNSAPTTTTTTTYTTTSVDPFYQDNVNINFGLNGMGFNMNMNGNVPATTQTTTTYTTTNGYTTVTPGYVAPAQQVYVNTYDPYYDPYLNPPPVQQVTTTTVYNNQPAYVQTPGCMVMAPGDFMNARNSIAGRSFEQTKLDMAKQLTNNYCFTTQQVKDIMSLFSFEGTKLDFAKYAYSYTIDQQNYFMVNDMFSFESSIGDLNQYIGGRR